jgi:hypothetical protein
MGLMKIHFHQFRFEEICPFKTDMTQRDLAQRAILKPTSRPQSFNSLEHPLIIRAPKFSNKAHYCCHLGLLSVKTYEACSTTISRCK